MKDPAFKNIKFSIEMDGLIYGCEAVPASTPPVACYVLSIEAMGHLYRVDMKMDKDLRRFTLQHYTNDIPPEIAELEFKLSEVLSNQYIQ